MENIINLHETTKNINCTKCNNFQSYYSEDDELEPIEFGNCQNTKEVIGEGYVCDLFETKDIICSF